MKILPTLSLLALSTAAPGAVAEPAPPEITTGVGAGALAGALLAGPPGAIVGAALGGAAGGAVGAVIEERDALAGDVAVARRHLAERNAETEALAGRLAGLEERFAAGQERLAAIEDAAANLSAGIWFGTGSAELDAADARRLSDLAGLLAHVPELGIHIEGHADVRGGTDTNATLSRARAVAVTEALRDGGVAPERLHVWYYGSEAARAEPSDPAGLAYDRRVDIRLAPADEALAGRTGTL